MEGTHRKVKIDLSKRKAFLLLKDAFTRHRKLVDGTNNQSRFYYNGCEYEYVYNVMDWNDSHPKNVFPLIEEYANQINVCIFKPITGRAIFTYIYVLNDDKMELMSENFIYKNMGKEQWELTKLVCKMLNKESKRIETYGLMYKDIIPKMREFNRLNRKHKPRFMKEKVKKI